MLVFQAHRWDAVWSVSQVSRRNDSACIYNFCSNANKMVEKRKFDYPGAEPAVWDIIFDGDIVVIGNIYDNPELLED